MATLEANCSEVISKSHAVAQHSYEPNPSEGTDATLPTVSFGMQTIHSLESKSPEKIITCISSTTTTATTFESNCVHSNTAEVNTDPLPTAISAEDSQKSKSETGSSFGGPNTPAFIPRSFTLRSSTNYSGTMTNAPLAAIDSSGTCELPQERIETMSSSEMHLEHSSETSWNEPINNASQYFDHENLNLEPAAFPTNPNLGDEEFFCEDDDDHNGTATFHVFLSSLDAR
jgi:hypothetical protein